MKQPGSPEKQGMKEKRGASPEEGKSAKEDRGCICCINDEHQNHSELKKQTKHLLFTIEGTGDTDIIAAGKNGAAFYYNGKTWNEMNTNDKLHIYRLACFSPKHYYACCRDGVIKKYNGEKWSKVHTCKLENGHKPTLFGIWGSSLDNIYVVGERHTVLHYDGEKWEKIEIPNDKNKNAYFYSVWGLSPKNIYFLGDQGELYHYDGKDFTKMNIPTKHWLMGIWGTSPNDLYIVGEDGTFFHYDGSSWEDLKNTRNCIFCITGKQDGNFYTMGYGDILSKHFQKSINRREIKGFKYISDLWISPSNKIYLIGETE